MISDLAAVLVNKIGRRLTRVENEAQEMAAPALGADFTAADEIAFRDDADQFPGRIDHRQPADVPFQHKICSFEDGGFRQDGKDRPGHNLMRTHGNLREVRNRWRAPKPTWIASLMQLNEKPRQCRSIRQIQMEVTMPELAETKAVEREQPADSATRQVDANKQTLHLMLGAQRMMLEEMAFAADAMIDRVQTETHLWSEFASKLASSHSMRNLNAGIGKHQLEFIRRDCDRLIRHGERLIEATSSLLDNDRNADAV
jgi:hypothetical protein